MINFTVIIPHKNIPQLLERLVRSIPERDDLEIIVVDDGSSPATVDFAHFPCSDRTNLKLIRNEESRGAGHARNCALTRAKGRWVLFADADDFFNPGFNDFLTDRLDSDADIIYFNANSVDTDTLEPSDRTDHLHDFISLYQHDKRQGELALRYLFTEPWCKMVKRKLIADNKIAFEETVIRNDVGYSYLVGHYARTIVVDDRQLYCVTSRQGSVSRAKGYQASMDELLVYAGWKRFLRDHHIPLELPKFDFRAYNFARHLYKDNALFRAEYAVMRKAGLSRCYIAGLTAKYLWTAASYKLQRHNRPNV